MLSEVFMELVVLEHMEDCLAVWRVGGRGQGEKSLQQVFHLFVAQYLPGNDSHRFCQGQRQGALDLFLHPFAFSLAVSTMCCNNVTGFNPSRLVGIPFIE